MIIKILYDNKSISKDFKFGWGFSCLIDDTILFDTGEKYEPLALNAEKLGKLIKEYSKNAQYIVVSHSEHLIQSSDVIYGATMNKYKISDILSLDLRDMKDYVEDIQ